MVLEKAVVDDLSDSASVHGVLVSVFGSGVLILGRSGIGKSACALELLDRGHTLIADDAVDLESADSTLIGNAPPALFGSLEVRGLGIVDVRQMFGEASALDRCEIDLCIEFRDSTDENPDRTESGVHSFSLLGVGVPTEGPLIVEEFDSTTVVHPSYSASVDEFGNLWLRKSVAE